MATLGLGKSNKYDLYFTMLNSMMYKSDFINLDDVLAMTPNGESKTITYRSASVVINERNSGVTQNVQIAKYDDPNNNPLKNIILYMENFSFMPRRKLYGIRSGGVSFALAHG